MQFRITRGRNNNYLLEGDHEIERIKIERSIHLLEQLEWKDDKIVILDYSIGPSEIEKEIEELLISALENKQITACHTISSPTQYLHFQQHTNLEQFKASFEDQLIENSLISIHTGYASSKSLIFDLLSENVSPIKLEVNLDALLSNVEFYKQKTDPVNKVMAMVKANAYGHGMIEVAQFLKNHVEYFGVAYVNEGIGLRLQEINTPVMVMNPSLKDFHLCLEYGLEPVVYDLPSLDFLEQLLSQLKRKMNIHIEIDTGMNRLGFEENEIDRLVETLLQSKFIKVAGIYSHLACAEDASEDHFNIEQQESFLELANKIESAIGGNIIKHIRNSAGTLRYPASSTDLIRPGIGIYGVDSNNMYQESLKNISVLKSEISTIRKVLKGETIGYNRTYNAEHDMLVATIAIGYADGFKRIFSNGVGNVIVGGQLAPVVGRVNMDMIMVDISNINAVKGDEVIIFNERLHPKTLAKNANTIPYEIFTSIGDRVERVYIINR